jgi:protease I
MPHAIFVVAQRGFRDEELIEPHRALEEAGWRCTIASSHEGVCTGMLGARVTATLALSEVRPEDYDAVVFIGGNGAHALFDDQDAHRLASTLAAANKVVAAICIAPTILARAGVLLGRHATSFASERTALVKTGAYVDDACVVVDGNIVTADGPRVAEEFGRAILAAAAATAHPPATTTSH